LTVGLEAVSLEAVEGVAPLCPLVHDAATMATRAQIDKIRRVTPTADSMYWVGHGLVGTAFPDRPFY
jgi:hypothetical protein